MSIYYRHRDEDRRPDRVTYVPCTTTADVHRHSRPSAGALTYSFAPATANVHGYAGRAIHLLTHPLDTAKDSFHENMDPPTNAYRHELSDRQPPTTDFDHPPSLMQQQQPVWPVKQNVSSYFQSNQQYAEPDRANLFERRAPPPALRPALEPWSDTSTQV